MTVRHVPKTAVQQHDDWCDLFDAACAAWPSTVTPTVNRWRTELAAVPWLVHDRDECPPHGIARPDLRLVAK